MTTDEPTLISLEKLHKQLKGLGVKSPELNKLGRHIGQQRKQGGWCERNGKWVRVKKYSKS